CRPRDEEARRTYRRSFSKVVLGMMVVGGLGYWVVTREQRVREAWDSLPVAVASKPASLQVRLSAVEELLAREKFWGGVFEAWRDRDQLGARLQRVQDEGVRAARNAALQKQERLQ